jgi:predicted ATPase/DNA-binding SARP family transcriptional activator
MADAPDLAAELPLQVSLLGPLEAQTTSGWAPINGTKQRALLALLALSTPRPVSDLRLLEELWGDEQPAKPANALQAQISQLRRVLGSEAVRRHGSGYALSVEANDIDAVRLDRLVRAGSESARQGQHLNAVAHFRSAIALVRGTPLFELLDLQFAREASSRLEQVGIAAYEGLVDAEVAAGRHADVVGLLSDLVVAHPLRERFHAQLMLVLFRCGRQSDALRAYQNVRVLLATEMGLEPGPELRALERSVLSHDPSLLAPIPLVAPRHVVSPATPITSFIGRSAELATIEDAIASCRITTLVGPAGSGKTRLAWEFTKRLIATEWWFVELAHLTDASAVAEAVAATIGATDHSPAGADNRPRSAEARIFERLGERKVLIVLDNCEHLISGVASFVRQVVLGCPGVSIVATSRESLGIDGERQITVSSMTDDDAVSLFIARSRDVQPRFETQENDDVDLLDLCRHLDGLPLAIELAAARTRSLPVPEIVARLHDRFQLLVQTKGAGSGRPGGLREAIDWSYDSLFEAEQATFRTFAVFAGGATVAAVRSVCGAAAIDIVDRLVDKSLLVADVSGRAVRYRVLESLRAYGLARLREEGELDDANTAHRLWCVELVESSESGIRGPDQIAWLDRLDAEHDNLRAALANSISADPATGLRMVGALILPWWFRGRGQEARQWLDRYLADDSIPKSTARIKAMSWCGLLADFGGGPDQPGRLENDLELAEQRQREAVADGLAAGAAILVAYARLQLSVTLTRRLMAGFGVDSTEISRNVDEAIETFERHGDDFGVGLTRLIEAVLALSMGDSHRTVVASKAASLAAVRSGDRFVQGRVEWINGLLARAAGDADGAYRHIERGLRLLDELGMGREVTAQAALLIELAERRGEFALAAQWQAFVEGRSGGLARHDVLLVASTRNSEGQYARLSGNLAGAYGAHLEALAAYTHAGVASAIAFTQSCLGFVAAANNDHAAARTHHAAALTSAMSCDEPARLALALEGLASGFQDDSAEWAASLLGAARAMWLASADSNSASHRDDISAVAERARTQLGEAAFEDAYRLGSSWTTTQALASAFSGAAQ